MDKKIAVFIDGANVYAASKMLGFDIDYARLKNFFGDHLVVANYYTAVKPRDKDVVDDLRPLLDWLEYNGYKVVSKPVKQYVAADGNTKTKGNMDAEMIVDMLELAPNAVKPNAKFSRIGLDSAMSVQLAVALEERLGIALSPDVIADHPTISQLVAHLSTIRSNSAP